MTYYITTDTHFGHDMLVRENHRGEGFENLILKNLKKVQGDVFLHLGDICIGDDKRWHEDLMTVLDNKFKKKILILGNHDNKSYSWYYDNGWDFVCETMRLRFLGKEVLFSHIPIPYNEEVDKNIHGHLHGAREYSQRSIEGYKAGFHYDCAPDTHNYEPVNLKSVV